MPNYPEVIDLMSDDSDLDVPAGQTPQPLELDANGVLSPLDELPPGAAFDFFGAPVPDEDRAPPELQREAPVHGQIVNIDGEDVFIPDEIEPEPAALVAGGRGHAFMPGGFRDEPLDAAAGAERDHDLDPATHAPKEITVEVCLQTVLEIFPDISHDHVRTLWNSLDSEAEGHESLPGSARLDNIIEQLVSATSYPKQERTSQPRRKRKREDSINEPDTKRWEREDREVMPTYLKVTMQAMLKAEFPEFPVHYVNETLAAQKHFYKAHVALANEKDGRVTNGRAYGRLRGRPPKNLASADTIAANGGWPPLTEELEAARARVQIIRAQHAADDARKQAEETNLQRAKERGETAECSACFDDLPLNRQIHCDGPAAHFTCFDCAETYIKSEVGESRCRVLCTAGCGAAFAPNQLNLLLDKQLLEKLAELEQEKAIRDANLEDLEECPFCDYKAIVPPLEEDFEFRCANPECEKISCRRCKSTTHIPISCEQHAKDNQIDHRHKIEEAMTAAMIRACNKCKKQFIKDYGCNKMMCPSCNNLQCYVCSQSLAGYEHFDQAPQRARTGETATKCPLYDNVEERHEREVKEAEAAARAQVLAENPNVQLDALQFKVSDAVQKATKDRIRKAGGVGGDGAGYAGMGGGHGWAAAAAMAGRQQFGQAARYIYGGYDGAADAPVVRGRDAVAADQAQMEAARARAQQIIACRQGRARRGRQPLDNALQAAAFMAEAAQAPAVPAAAVQANAQLQQGFDPMNPFLPAARLQRPARRHARHPQPLPGGHQPEVAPPAPPFNPFEGLGLDDFAPEWDPDYQPDAIGPAGDAANEVPNGFAVGGNNYQRAYSRPAREPNPPVDALVEVRRRQAHALQEQQALQRQQHAVRLAQLRVQQQALAARRGEHAEYFDGLVARRSTRRAQGDA
ncbi:hypothetical protein LTR53_005920 [Teratosphaeriaceae sp. CCFEE 6253]|nr:hypothetical protein LTR53_005920 [Teratosphaeriaceae sp. CCFEE 6253]